MMETLKAIIFVALAFGIAEALLITWAVGYFSKDTNPKGETNVQSSRH